VPKKRERSRLFKPDLTKPEPGIGALAETPELFPGPTTTYVEKLADETIQSDTTFSDDAELFFPVRANERWEVGAVILYDTQAATDIKFTYSVPGSAPVGNGVCIHIKQGGANREELILNDIDLAAGFNAGGIGTGDANIVALHWTMNILVGDADGNIALQWAQQTSAANNTTVRANSWIIGRKVS
jgi:hypothetical protein